MTYSRKRKASRSRRNTTPQRGPFSALAKSVLFTLPVTVAIGFLLLLATSALLLCTKDPGRYSSAAGFAVLYLTAFIGGAIATRSFDRPSPLLCGTVMGLSLFLLLCIPALFPSDSGIQNAALAFLARAALVPVTLLGAFLCTKKKKKRRR